MTVDAIKEKLLHIPAVRKMYANRLAYLASRKYARHQLDMVYKPEDLNQTYYDQIKTIGDRELEHQIGRLTHFKQIIDDCRHWPGHFIEFGTYRGFSLLWIAYLLERAAMFDRKIVGLDGFAGLPYADGSFSRRSFNNNSLQLCRRHVLGHRRLYDATKKNITIEQCFFNQTDRIMSILQQAQATSFCFIHIDCDVSRSFKEIFSLLQRFDLIAPVAYLLFDDYGLKTNLAGAIQQKFALLAEQWDIAPHSATRFTRNFIFKKK